MKNIGSFLLTIFVFILAYAAGRAFGIIGALVFIGIIYGSSLLFEGSETEN